MHSKKTYLVVMSVPDIDGYVYGTDRLVEIRGASGLLDLLNRVETARYLRDCLKETSAFEEGDIECIFAGGGEGQFLIRATLKNLEEAIRNLKSYFHKESKGGLWLHCGISELGGNNYKEALEAANIDLEKDQQEDSFLRFLPLHAGYIQECESCSGMLRREIAPGNTGEHEGVDLFNDRILCKICRQKVKHGRKRRLWNEMNGYLRRIKWDIPDGFDSSPKDFEEIGKLCKAKAGYTALVYADGNNMTKLLRSIDDTERFRSFSLHIDESIREACYEAIYTNCRPVSAAEVSKKTVPCDILLLGGDDLLLFMSADNALPFVIDIAERFTRKTRERFHQDSYFARVLEGRGLTLSFGIAYGKSHTPFSIMFRQAGELLKSAKMAGSKDPEAQGFYKPTYIDYHLTSYFNQLSVEDSRAMHLQLSGTKGKRLCLYQKPYSLKDATDLLHHARKLANSGIPHNRLKRLENAPLLGMLGGTLECLKIYTRTDMAKRHLLWDALARFRCAHDLIPWAPPDPARVENGKDEEEVWNTVVMDLVELTEFIALQER